MNYDEPREIKDGPQAGKWHFTTMNRRTGTRPIGYCAEGCPGHDTAKEAREHYRQYRLDKELRFVDDNPKADTKHRCEVDGCENFTSGRIDIGAWLTWYACAEHRNRENAEVLYPTAGDSMHS